VNTLFLTSFGSHLYGLNTPSSDTDFAGVYVPPAKEIVLQTAKRSLHETTGNDASKNGVEDVDKDMFSLHYFFELLHRGEMKAVDLLFAPSNAMAVCRVSPVYRYIWQNRDKYVHTNLDKFIGYIYGQAAKYGVKGSRMGSLEKAIEHCQIVWLTGGFEPTTKLKDIPGFLKSFPVSEDHLDVHEEFVEVLGKKFQLTIPFHIYESALKNMFSKYGERARMAKENNGIDWKAVSHAIRAAYQLIELFDTGDLKFPLSGYPREYIMSVKKGELDFNSNVKPVLESLFEEVKTKAVVANKNGMPDKLPEETVSFTRKLVYDVYLESIRNETGLYATDPKIFGRLPK